MMHSQLRLSQLWHKHKRWLCPQPAIHRQEKTEQLTQSLPFPSTIHGTQQMSSTQIMAHVTTKSNGTALVHYNVPKKLNWPHILPSMTSDIIPTQPPTMANCLQSHGTAALSALSTVAAYVMGAVHINSETSKTSSMLNAHADDVRAPQQLQLYPAVMLPLHDEHSRPCNNRRTIGDP